ncbi:hypothetical protein COCNU_10G008800 [Cocos nucifera]|uniref:Uncharacterized protein n=1 Tax=Cocos nucifera TaxID=13894 RepID=A0A8K0IM30_COCNU|nr:hypothetical protein COCNU_10G008800 [Cocos nucifera]
MEADDQHDKDDKGNGSKQPDPGNMKAVEIQEAIRESKKAQWEYEAKRHHGQFKYSNYESDSGFGASKGGHTTRDSPKLHKTQSIEEVAAGSNSPFNMFRNGKAKSTKQGPTNFGIHPTSYILPIQIAKQP